MALVEYLRDNSSSGDGQYHYYVMAYAAPNSGTKGDSMQIQKYNGVYGDWYSAHTKSLTVELRNINGLYIAKYLMGLGWTKNAVCGMLGNMQSESACNPGAWEGYKYHDKRTKNWGIGLVQWSNPNYKYTDWAIQSGKQNIYDIDIQCDRLKYESDNNIQFSRRSKYNNISFREFVLSTENPGWLGEAFGYCYEKSASITGANGPEAQQQALAARRNNALAWWDRLGGGPYDPAPDVPPGTDPEPDPGADSKNIPVWMLAKFRRR